MKDDPPVSSTAFKSIFLIEWSLPFLSVPAVFLSNLLPRTVSDQNKLSTIWFLRDQYLSLKPSYPAAELKNLISVFEIFVWALIVILPLRVIIGVISPPRYDLHAAFKKNNLSRVKVLLGYLLMAYGVYLTSVGVAGVLRVPILRELSTCSLKAFYAVLIFVFCCALSSLVEGVFLLFKWISEGDCDHVAKDEAL